MSLAARGQKIVNFACLRHLVNISKNPANGKIFVRKPIQAMRLHILKKKVTTLSSTLKWMGKCPKYLEQIVTVFFPGNPAVHVQFDSQIS